MNTLIQMRIRYSSNNSKLYLITLILFATMFSINDLYANKSASSKNSALLIKENHKNIGNYFKDSKVKNVIKTTSSILTKNETKVIACRNIILTLPAINNSDNGLSILIKNNGLHTDLITVIGNEATTINGNKNSTLTRGKENTFVAFDGNWVFKSKKNVNNNNVYVVSSSESWKTIPEILEFLKIHMTAPSIIRLDDRIYNITNTQVVDLPFSVTFEGSAFGSTKIIAKSGLAGKSMFRCISNSYFKMIMFEGKTLKGFGSKPGEDAIRLVGSGTYNEIKDCSFNHFYNTIVDSSNAAVWLFQCDVSNSHKNGFLIHGDIPGVRVRIARTNFINCKKGVNMDKGSNAIVQLNLGSFYNENNTDTAIIYNPSAFSFSTMIITNNAWNNVGKLICGFDFSRPDKRDLNAYVESNDGYENMKPHSKINVLFNTVPTIVKTAGTWEKANFTGTNVYLVEFGLIGNHLTYLSDKENEGVMNISGNILCSNDSVVFSVTLVKNGEIEKKYGETAVIISNSEFEYQWFMNIVIDNMSKEDYFEIWITSNTSNDVYILQDVQWFCNIR